MRVIVDSDALIKITKASIKDLVTSKFEVYVSREVQKETVQEGKMRGYPDASIVSENMVKGKVKLAEARHTKATNRLVTSLNLHGGEADSLSSFQQGNYDAIVSDDSRFINLIAEIGIPFMTPSALIIRLREIKAIDNKQALEHLNKIKPYVSADEYWASIQELEKET